MPELCSNTSSSQNFELSTLLCASHSRQHSLRDWTVGFKFPGCKACHFSPSKNCSAVQICDCRCAACLSRSVRLYPQPLEAGLQQNLSQLISARVSMRAHACFGAPPPPSYTALGLSLKASQGRLKDHMPIMLTYPCWGGLGSELQRARNSWSGL